MEEKDKKKNTPQKGGQDTTAEGQQLAEVKELKLNKLERKKQAQWKLAALIGAALMCSALLLHLVVDQPSDADLIIHAYAREQGISALQYPENLVELLERNPETKEFVLNYPAWKEKNNQGETTEIDLSAVDPDDGIPLFMQWDERWGYMTYGSDMVAITGSGPMCLAMAGYYVTEDATFYPDRVVKFADKNGFSADEGGSKATLISVCGQALGLTVKDLAPEEEKVAAYLQAHYPIIALMGPGDFTDSSHFIVLKDYRDGMLTVNDPNSYLNSGKEWEFRQIKGQIKNLWVIFPGTQE